MIKYLTEIAGWIWIAGSPTLIGLITGFLCYQYLESPAGLITGVILLACGLILGILWANKIYKSRGTMNFISRIYASPELDNEKEN